MGKRPEISVIVPVYKAEQYLPQCIDSILRQSFIDFELLLIDDGSPDKCGEICDDYACKDERIHVFHQHNAGVGGARNMGLHYAKGTYITFIDSDDWVEPDYLFHLYEVLPAESTGLVMGGALKCSVDGSLIGQIVLPERLISNIGRDFVEYRLDRFGFSCSKLYNAELIRQNKLCFDCNVYCMEDLFFMMDYILFSDYILLCSFTDYNYRIGYSDSTLSSRINTYENEYQIFLAYRYRIEKFESIYSLPDLTEYLKQSLNPVFQRVLLSLHVNEYSLEKRKFYLKDLLDRERHWIIKNYEPNYKADRIAKYLLCYIGGVFFDCWISLLRFWGFKKSFGM